MMDKVSFIILSGIPTPDLSMMIWSGLSFLILLFLLWRFVWPKILTALDQREQFIKDSLKDAQTAKEELSNIEEKTRKIILDAEEEAKKIRASAKEQGLKIQQQIEETAKKEAGNLKELSIRECSVMKEQILLKIKEEVSVLTLELVEKVFKEKFNANNNSDVIKKSLENL